MTALLLFLGCHCAAPPCSFGGGPKIKQSREIFVDNGYPNLSFSAPSHYFHLHRFNNGLECSPYDRQSGLRQQSYLLPGHSPLLARLVARFLGVQLQLLREGPRHSVWACLWQKPSHGRQRPRAHISSVATTLQRQHRRSHLPLH